jgi:hypothetical protein
MLAPFWALVCQGVTEETPFDEKIDKINTIVNGVARFYCFRSINLVDSMDYLVVIIDLGGRTGKRNNKTRTW